MNLIESKVSTLLCKLGLVFDPQHYVVLQILVFEENQNCIDVESSLGSLILVGKK